MENQLKKSTSSFDISGRAAARLDLLRHSGTSSTIESSPLLVSIEAARKDSPPPVILYTKAVRDMDEYSVREFFINVFGTKPDDTEKLMRVYSFVQVVWSPIAINRLNEFKEQADNPKLRHDVEKWVDNNVHRLIVGHSYAMQHDNERIDILEAAAHLRALEKVMKILKFSDTDSIRIAQNWINSCAYNKEDGFIDRVMGFVIETSPN